MRRLLRQLRPDRFEDIVALIALYRPGPMEEIPKYIEGKHDPRQVKYLHPLLEEITGDTYGVLVYQEQIVTLLQKVAGYTAGEADLVRKAIGKKIEALMRAEEPRFLAGCREKGLTDDQAGHPVGADPAVRRLLVQPGPRRLLRPGRVSDRVPQGPPPGRVHGRVLTASRTTRTTSRSTSVLPRMGIEVLPPDVNESDSDFTPRRGRQRAGDPLRPLRRAQRRRGGRREDHRRPAGRAASPASSTSAGRSTPARSTSARSSR